jgi:cytochrome c-type biogenesis protein CcmF
MPWLVGTALIHSLAVTEKRGIFKSWTLILAIIAFSLSLLGTFLVRSGVIVSVHAFASDPKRGIFILAFLSICIVGALALYAWRASHFKPESGFAIVSRESLLLLNNILLVVAAAVVLISTLYPLFLEALHLGQSSVGAPFLWLVFPIPTLPLVAIVGIGMHASWKRADFAGVRRQLAIAGVIGLAVSLGVVLPLYGWSSIMTVLGVAIGIFIAISALIEPVSRWRKGHSLNAATLGMCLAHFGVAIFVLGASMARSYTIEQDLKLAPGDTVKVAGYEFTFRGTQPLTGPNYEGIEGDVKISRNGSEVAIVHPQKRIYRVQRNPMTEAAIVPRLHRDLFVALGDELGDGRTWSMRIQYKPFLRFLWLGTLLMASGGLVATLDRRYRTARVKATSGAGDAALAKEST